MKIIEYGQENARVILLLHGGGLSWWNYRGEAALMQKNYHVILPILDGHAGSDVPFTSIEDNARELIRYLDEKFGGPIFAAGGLSLGGQILVEMLSQRKDICHYAMIESALVVPMPLTCALLSPALEMSYGLIRKKWFAKMQFQALKMDTDYFSDYYCDTCKIAKPDMIRFLMANTSYAIKPELAHTTAKTLLLVGGHEQRKMLRSAEMLHHTISGSELQVLDGYDHGQLSLNHPAEYAGLMGRLTDAAAKGPCAHL
jgi:pimeloyl-ACP methyl ester carboxylesterase